MSDSMKAMRVVRGVCQSLCVVLSVLVCCALSAQNNNETIAFEILFWFTVPGRMVPAGKACTTF